MEKLKKIAKLVILCEKNNIKDILIIMYVKNSYYKQSQTEIIKKYKTLQILYKNS